MSYVDCLVLKPQPKTSSGTLCVPVMNNYHFDEIMSLWSKCISVIWFYHSDEIVMFKFGVKSWHSGTDGFWVEVLGLDKQHSSFQRSVNTDYGNAFNQIAC